MLSPNLRKAVLAPSVAIALAIAPLTIAGCGNNTPDVPTEEDFDKAAKDAESKGETTTTTTTSGGGGGGAPASDTSSGTPSGTGDEGSEATYDEEGNLVVNTAEGSGRQSEKKSADGNYATSDFTKGSAIYGKKTATITNQYQFVTDGIGTWEMVALKDEDGDVFAGSEIKPTTLTMTADNLGTINVNGEQSAFGWQQYKDFPQLALGDVGKMMTLTMEINDSGMLTVRQDSDGQVMLFKKAAA